VELFTITCTTCRQRLKVCDAGTIGEIEICPKCGSMVLVEPPLGWTAPLDSEPPVVLAEVSTTGLGVQPPPADSGFQASPPGGAAPPESPGVPAVPPDGAPGEADPASAEPPVVEPLPPPSPGGEAADSEPLMPTEDWTSQAARQRQQWLMLGGAALGGIVLALGLVSWLASRAAQRADQPAAPLDAVADATGSGASTPSSTSSASRPDPAAPAGEPAAAATGPNSPSADAGPAPSPPETAPPAENPPAASLETAPPAESPEVTPPPEMPAAESPPSPPAAPAAEPASAPKPQAGNLDPGALSETLNAFAPFIDPNVDAGPPQPLDTTGPEMPELDPQTLTSDQPSAPRPEPRSIDVAARLQDKIAEVEFADVPLKNFLRFVMNFSTIPVSLDPDALALVRATPRSPIRVRQADATVAQLLAAALGPLQLAPLTVDHQIVVTRPQLADGALRTYTLGVSDLVGNDPQALSQLADLIVELVEPASWEAAGGAGVIREEPPALVIQQQETILFRTIVFCERLRAARDLPPQSKFDPALFTLEPRWAQAAPRLAKPVTLNFPLPASFTRILERLSDEGGVEILIDWPALMQLGWTPDTETTVTANQRAVGEVLTAMLQPMELTYRVLDASTVQVTSPAAAQARWDIEFYPLAELAAAGQTPDAILTQVRNELTNGHPESLAGSLHFDPPSRRLIAALPQSVQRTLAERLHAEGQRP